MKKAKNRYHSFKLNCLSRRYQFIFDGKGIVKGLWGGYSPNINDSLWCEANRQTLERDFEGGVIIANQDYQKFMRTIDSPRFITPVRVTSQVRTNGPQDISQNSEEQKRLNRLIREVRILSDYGEEVLYPLQEIC